MTIVVFYCQIKLDSTGFNQQAVSCSTHTLLAAFGEGNVAFKPQQIPFCVLFLRE